MPDTTRPQLSACIITRNEADRIVACLQSVAFCDDIVVVDSASTDATRELAQAHGARVLVRAFDGYRTQKDFAVRNARHDWVLCLDADERVTPQLRAAIEAARSRRFCRRSRLPFCARDGIFRRIPAPRQRVPGSRHAHVRPPLRRLAR